MTKFFISTLSLVFAVISGFDARIVSVDNTGKLGKEEWKIKASRDGFGENLLGTDDNLPDPDGFVDEAQKMELLQLKQQQRRRQPDVDRLEKMLFKDLNEFKHPKFPLSVQNYFALWRDYKREHGKKYNSYDEEKRRFGIFMQHHEEIRLHNIAYDLGLKTFSMQLNKYSDMDHDEFVRTMNGYKQSLKYAAGPSTDSTGTFLRPLNFLAPDNVDWRKEGYVTPVKDQGHCGSCWSFSATGSLEGQTFRKTGKLISLSEQNLVDCSWKYGDEGCNGGLMDNAFQYIKENHGVDTEASYPYEAKDGRCRFKKQNVGAMDVGYQDVESGDEDALKDALASIGPVSVAMDAGHKSFQHYHTGIYFEPNCSSSALDHGVLAVGYGSLGEDKDFWLIKNSWGVSWGDKGYVKIARNRENHCGIATQASYPVV